MCHRHSSSRRKRAGKNAKRALGALVDRLVIFQRDLPGVVWLEAAQAAAHQAGINIVETIAARVVLEHLDMHHFGAAQARSGDQRVVQRRCGEQQVDADKPRDLAQVAAQLRRLAVALLGDIPRSAACASTIDPILVEVGVLTFQLLVTPRLAERS